MGSTTILGTEVAAIITDMAGEMEEKSTSLTDSLAPRTSPGSLVLVTMMTHCTLYNDKPENLKTKLYTVGVRCWKQFKDVDVVVLSVCNKMMFTS